MDVERAFSVVGCFGKYQALLFFSVASSSIVMAFQMILMVFVGATAPLKAGKGGKLQPVGMYTVVDEWNLRGNREYIVGTMQAVFMLGVLIGNISIGQMSDKYGRKPVFYKVLLLLIFVSFLTTFSSDWRVFCVLRFFCGLFQGGVVLVGFVLAQELVGSSKWPVTGSILQILFSIGLIILAWLASIFTYWRNLCVVTSVPAIVFLFTYWIVPESPRWLYSQGKVGEAEAVLQYLAKKNGKSASEVASIVLEKKGEKRPNNRGYSMADLFSSKNLMKRTVVMAYTWFVCSFTYYGLTLAAKDLTENLYISVALSGLVEIPANLVCAVMLNRIWAGRRRTLIAFLLCVGVSCLSIMLLPDASEKSNLKTTLALGGKCGISAAFCLIYIYASELFPTVVRNVGMGSSSMSARLGGILSPYVHLMVGYGASLPYLIYGVLSIFAGVMVFFLPETLNTPIPDTLEDVSDDRNTVRTTLKKMDEEADLVSGDGNGYVNI